MKIEGLGGNTNPDSGLGWYINSGPDSSPFNSELTKESMKVGLKINDVGDNEWVITDVLGDGKFRAVPKDRYDYAQKSRVGVDDFASEDLNVYLEQSKETFDISGKVDTNNPIYRFYEKEVGKYLTKKYGAKRITDAQGVTWWEIDVPKAAAKAPVEAFGAVAGVEPETDEEGRITKVGFDPAKAAIGVVGGKLAQSPGVRRGADDLARAAKSKLQALRAGLNQAGKTGPSSTQLEALERLPFEEQVKFSSTVKEKFNDVKSKVNLLDYFATPEFVLRKVGLGAQANAMRTGYEAYLKELPKQIDRITGWMKRVEGIKGAEQNIFRYLDGKSGVTLSEPELKVATEIKTYLAEWADRLDLPKDARIANYITHIFEESFIKKEFDTDLARLITDKIPGSVYDPFLQERLGKLGYKEDAFAALDAYVKRATRKVNLDPALEHLKKAGELLDPETYKYVQRFASHINLRPTEADNLIDNFVKSVVGYRLGQRPTTRVTRELRRAVYRGTLGLNIGSAVKNLTQGANTYAKLGEKYTVIGYAKLFSRMATNRLDELKDVGVLTDDLIQDRKIGVYKSLLQKMDDGLYVFFNLAEKINRGSAYYGAKARAIARGASEAEAVQTAKKLVRETQFAFGSLDSPVALSSDLGKTILQLQTYNLKQAEFLTNMLKNRELGGLLRWTGASLAMVYSVGKLLGMEPKDLIPSFRLGGTPLGNALQTLSGLALGDEQKREEAKRGIGRNIAVFTPAGTQIRKTAEAMRVYARGKDVTASGRTRFQLERTPGNLVRGFLFGKRAYPESQKYYDRLEGKEDVLKPANRFNR